MRPFCIVEFMALWHIIHSSQFGVIGKVAEGTCCPIIQTFSEDVKRIGSNTDPVIL